MKHCGLFCLSFSNRRPSSNQKLLPEARLPLCVEKRLWLARAPPVTPQNQFRQWRNSWVTHTHTHTHTHTRRSGFTTLKTLCVVVATNSSSDSFSSKPQKQNRQLKMTIVFSVVSVIYCQNSKNCFIISSSACCKDILILMFHKCLKNQSFLRLHHKQNTRPHLSNFLSLLPFISFFLFLTVLLFSVYL